MRAPIQHTYILISYNNNNTHTSYHITSHHIISLHIYIIINDYNTGGAGTGKTTTLCWLIDRCRSSSGGSSVGRIVSIFLYYSMCVA